MVKNEWLKKIFALLENYEIQKLIEIEHFYSIDYRHCDNEIHYSAQGNLKEVSITEKELSEWFDKNIRDNVCYFEYRSNNLDVTLVMDMPTQCPDACKLVNTEIKRIFKQKKK